MRITQGGYYQFISTRHYACHAQSVLLQIICTEFLTHVLQQLILSLVDMSSVDDPLFVVEE